MWDIDDFSYPFGDLLHQATILVQHKQQHAQQVVV